jgi:hypothetical protein
MVRLSRLERLQGSIRMITNLRAYSPHPPSPGVRGESNRKPVHDHSRDTSVSVSATRHPRSCSRPCSLSRSLSLSALSRSRLQCHTLPPTCTSPSALSRGAEHCAPSSRRLAAPHAQQIYIPRSHSPSHPIHPTPAPRLSHRRPCSTSSRRCPCSMLDILPRSALDLFALRADARCPGRGWRSRSPWDLWRTARPDIVGEELHVVLGGSGVGAGERSA